ncbi:Putative pentatricopeptide repeat-containing protein At3g15130 [Linum perenne]
MPERNLVAWTALMCGYVQNGYPEESLSLFSQMGSTGLKKHLISWSALILGYAQEEKLEEAMDLFKLLRGSTVHVDEYVLSSIMAIFADFALVEQGRQIHGFSHKIPSGLRISVCNSALDMYLKCGMIEDAEKLLSEMPARDVVSWTVMITGYGKHGLGKEAVHLFNRMVSQNIKPDEVTYLAILLACSHSGLELHDIDEESKQESLRLHSEKLAIGLALVCGGWEKGRVIRVFKNLRVCVDCHEFIKGLSRILQVVFVVRDANRFHRFENGLCSCRDYW